jgi:hypothetical protein
MSAPGESGAGEMPIGLPASLAGFADEARFTLMIDGQKLGTLQVAWRADGSFATTSRIVFAGQTAETSVTIVPDGEGRWREVTCRLAAGTLTVTRQGSNVTRRFKERTSTLETPEGCLLFDQEAPMLISQALRLYDHAEGGVQTFPLLLAIKTPATLSLEATETAVRSAGGRDLALTRFRYGVPGIVTATLASTR